MNLIGLIFVAAGIFCILGAVLNWDWFINSRKARLIVKLLSRNGARIFYGLLGAGIVTYGILVIANIVQLAE